MRNEEAGDNMENDENKKTIIWFRRHVDTVIILSAFAASMLWMNGKFNNLEKDIVMIKTVLIMKNIMPTELCTKSQEK
jgi:hypothetical protein